MNEFPKELQEQGRTGEFRSINYFKVLGLDVQQADKIGFVAIRRDSRICGKLIRAGEVVRGEVKTRHRLHEPPPFYGVYVEEVDLMKYKEFYDATNMNTLVMLVVKDNEDEPNGSDGAYFIQWLPILLAGRKDIDYVERKGRCGERLRNYRLDYFYDWEKYIFGKNMKLLLEKLKNETSRI